jgi:Mrp family chromosome partitioning ATPase
MEYTVNSPYLKMMSNAERITEKYSAQVVIARNEFIFTTAAIALLAGLLAPVGARFVDVLWVLSVCLSGAVVLIGLAAKESGELSSFPLLLLAGSWLRIALAAASARLIFLGGSGGVIIESIGGMLGSGGAIGTVIIMAVAAASAGLGVYSATRRITKASLSFAFDTMPLKKISIETELNAGIIDSDKAASLKEKIAGETQFYLNMAGVTKLLRCDAAVAVLVVILTGAGQIAITAIDRMSASGEALTQTYVSLASGVAILALGPAFLTAMAAAHLLGKSSLSLGGCDSTEHRSRTIKIVSAETGRKEKVELLNPDFAQVGPRQTVEAKGKPMEENIASFEPVRQAGKGQSKVIRCIAKFNNIEDYYNDIVRRIESAPSEQKVVLFGASSVEDLPVTVAVNVAIRISKKGQRCLLIDGDTERGAIGKVFELESEAIKDRAAQTCIKNLSVRGGPDVTRVDVKVVKEKMQTIASDYDRVIIYAPNINSASRCEALSGIADGAIIFKGAQSNDGLSSQLGASVCKLVAIMPAASIAV